MQTFLFSELTERGQEAACDRYQEERIVEEWVNEHPELQELEETQALARVKEFFDSLGWRFTEHGERIG